jgi:uncharacterized protein YyaL (SSP411 family)
MYAARLERPTPFIDKTVYVNWNALCVSAYLKAAVILDSQDARSFALRSLDRILAQAWSPEAGLRHVVAYADGNSARADSAGFLDDYAFTAIACLDAYEATADLSYFRTAKKIVDRMVARFWDSSSAGFVDAAAESQLGVLGTSRKPFQDSPTPAGNPSAAIALIRMHGYTGEPMYRDKAAATLRLLTGVAGQYGLFAATYGIAVVQFSIPHTQVVVIGEDEQAASLYACATSLARLGTSVLKLTLNATVAPNLPPSLAETIPNLPWLKEKRSGAVLCSEGSCKPPAYSSADLTMLLD